MRSPRGVDRRAANGSRRADGVVCSGLGRTRAGPVFAVAIDAVTRRFRPPAGWRRRLGFSRHALVEDPADFEALTPWTGSLAHAILKPMLAK